MAEAVRAVPPANFQTSRFRKREETEFGRWLAEPSTMANDFYIPATLSLEDEVFLGRMRTRQPSKPAQAYSSSYAALPGMDEDGQYVFEFMRIPPGPIGARMDELI